MLAAVAAGEPAVALADRGGNVGDLESSGFAADGSCRPAASNAFRKNERTKYGWRRRASAFSISSFTAKSRSGVMVSCASALRFEQRFQVVVVEGVVDLLASAGADFGLVAVADGLA